MKKRRPWQPTCGLRLWVSSLLHWTPFPPATISSLPNWLLSTTAMDRLSSLLEQIRLLRHKYNSSSMQDSLASRHCPREQVGGSVLFTQSLCVLLVSLYFNQKQHTFLQHWRQVWRRLLRQRVDHQRRLDVLASTRHLSEHLRHWNNLLSFWLSKLHIGLQVGFKFTPLKKFNQKCNRECTTSDY